MNVDSSSSSWLEISKTWTLRRSGDAEMDRSSQTKRLKQYEVQGKEEPDWMTGPAPMPPPKPRVISYGRRNKSKKSQGEDGGERGLFPHSMDQKCIEIVDLTDITQKEIQDRAPQVDVARKKTDDIANAGQQDALMAPKGDTHRQMYAIKSVAFEDVSLMQAGESQDRAPQADVAQKKTDNIENAAQQDALMAPTGDSQNRQMYAFQGGEKGHANLWSQFFSSMCDVRMVVRAFEESAHYQDLLLKVDMLKFTTIEEGFKLKLPVSCIFSGIGKEPKPNKTSSFTFVVRAKEMYRLCQFLGMKRLLPDASCQENVSQIPTSQGSTQASSSSEELGSVGSSWTYVTGCTGCGLTILALELAMRLRRNSEPVLFIRADSHDAFLSLAQSVAMTVVGMQDVAMLEFIKKACFDANEKLMKDLYAFKTMLLTYVSVVCSSGTCKVICIVDSGHVLYEEENNPFSQLLMLLKTDPMWNRWCQTIVFGRRSIYSDALAMKCHIVETKLELESVQALLSKRKIELQDDELYELQIATGFLAKDIVYFMELWLGEFEKSMHAFKEMKCRVLSSAIPLALSKLPEIKAALIPRGVLLMRAGIMACGEKLPFDILWDYMYITRTSEGNVIMPTSELVGSFLWAIVMESKGEKSGFETVSHICGHINKNKALFGPSVVGKCVEIMITSYINAYGRFIVVASSITSRKKLNVDYKGMPNCPVSGNKVPSLVDVGDIIFLWFTSPSFPCIDAMIIDKKIKRAIAIQVTTMPIALHPNEFYGNSNDNGKVCQAAEWAKSLQISKDSILELWIGLEKTPGLRDWTDCSNSWHMQPNHFYVSISDLIVNHSPYLDGLKPLYC